MESVFGINMVALQDGQPKLMNLKDFIEAFIRHRREVVTRRTVYDLRKARERGHILEGLAIALANIDEVIALIKASPSSAEAKVALMARAWGPGAVPEMLARAGSIQTRPDGLADDVGLRDNGYRLSEAQAQAILDLRLHRLTGLEQDKILAEYAELLELIRDLADILARPERLLAVIRAELLEIREQYGDERRTRIEVDESDLTIEDLITPRGRGGDAVARRLCEGAAGERVPRAGARRARPVRDRDEGRGFRRQAVRREHARHAAVLLEPRPAVLAQGVPVAADRPRRPRQADRQPAAARARQSASRRCCRSANTRMTATSSWRPPRGTVKKTPLSAFSRPRSAGIIAVGLDEGDKLVGVAITDGTRDVMLCSSGGKAVRFPEDDVRAMGRTAAGVRGIRVPDDEDVISLIIPDADGLVLTASENGFGKLTPVDEFPVHGRGGQGVIAMQTTERNGRLVAATQVATTDELMLMSSNGTLVRTRAGEISVLGRNTQGVRLIRLDEGERLIGVEAVEPETGDVEDESAAAQPESDSGSSEPPAPL